MSTVPASAIPAATRMGEVALTVADLDRSVAFWTGDLGLQVHRREGRVAHLGAGGEDLVVLHEEPGARPFPGRGRTGLFHVALLVPSRPALARVLTRLARRRTPLGGLSDHLVSEAIYLSDPDGHGIEVYADRPRESWPRAADGSLEMATLPLDVEGLLATDEAADGQDVPLPPATTIGHVHLHVRDIPEAEAFYREALGLELMVRYGTQASFLAAGGYHHHVAVNTWAGVGAPPAEPGTAALTHATIVLPEEADLSAVAARLEAAGAPAAAAPGRVLTRDPSGNRLLLRTAGG